MGFKILGVGHFVEFTPLGAFVPHLTLGDFGTRDPDKNGFCSGRIAPHLGEIWGLAGVHFLAHFFSKFLPVILEILS